MTLVEAVAGMVILATLLVSILTARTQLTNQTHRAENRIEACRLLDGLLEQWRVDPAKMTDVDTGQFEDHDGWSWRSRKIIRDEADAVNADVLAVDVFAPGPTGSPAVATVEVLLPREVKDATTEPTK